MTSRVQCFGRFATIGAIVGTILTRDAQGQRPAARAWKPVPPVAFSPSIRRQPSDSLWTRVWIAGADTTAAELFIEPRQLAVTTDLVTVLDLGTREVRALDAKTGATRFVLHPAGDGPGEFRRPAMLATTPTGFAVLDHANARLSAFDRAGRVRWSTPMRDVFTMNGLCIGTSGRIVSTHTRRDSSVVESDSSGRVRTVRSVPWQQLVRGAAGFAYSHVTSNAASDRCVMAPLFGSEWAVVPIVGAPRRFALLEPGAQPVVTVSTTVLERSMTRVVQSENQQSTTAQSSRGALLIGDTAIVYAAHTTSSPLLWLDYYLASTGDYLYSRKLPFIVIALAIGGDGTFYATRIGESRSVVIAMRPAAKESTARKPARH